MRSIFQVFQRGLQRTRTSLVRRIQALFEDTEHWDEAAYERLEAALIGADLGVDVNLRLVDEIRDRYKRGLIASADDILEAARQDILGLLSHQNRPDTVPLADVSPTVVLMVGVNGSGKTTTAAKLAHLWKEDGRTVILAACDTYRAAGTEQLQLWGERVGCQVVAGKQGGDSAAVAFDAVTAARRRTADVVIVDTAGRQHTRRDLMGELAKIRRTVGKACEGAPHEVLLTLDASTGTNAITQAREFGRQCEVTGLILTKLDGTGKGGVVVGIRRELGYPVYFVGLGEKMEDLQPFSAELFTRALLE